jgi:ribonucleotide reductase alpha subunit
MKVIKRNGDSVEMLFDKVTRRISKLNSAPEFEVLHVQPDKVAQKVFASLYDGISTSEIDTLSAEVAIGMITEHPDYETLAMRITVSNLQKTSPKCFSDCAVALHTMGILSTEFMKTIKLDMDSWIVSKRDYDFGYFGIKTLQRGYLLPGETPQYMFMRVALGIHGEDLARVRETYDLMSQKYFTHATPTLFNAGTNRPQMSSCFLVAAKDDSIEGIYDTLKECAQISKWSGGIGLHISNIRANGTPIKGTNGVADGIVPMLRVFNNTARYVNQGGGKRKGSFAVYLEPWHADIMEFLDLRLNQGDEEARCRDLFTALWVPDLFMEAVEKNGDWFLMCPNESPNLQNVYGEEFNEMYRMYVAQGRYKKKVKARDVWDRILRSQVETGTPYMCYKDSVNEKSNQKNVGTIKSSNLCVAPETEIMTLNGYVKISELVDREVAIWNGFEFSLVTVRKTSESSKLIKINFDNGTFLECTEYHKFHLVSGLKEAKDLTPGDVLIDYVEAPTVGDIGKYGGLKAPGNAWHEAPGHYVPKVYNGPGVKPKTKGVRVVSIEDTGRRDATYCFNEPKRHMGIFNGVIAGNCTEIMEVSTPEETAVCNLASLCLPSFVCETSWAASDGTSGTEKSFDFVKFHQVVRTVTRNLNRVIDKNYYPTRPAYLSNMRHRPIGLGVQGLADVFMMLGLPFDSPEARKINTEIFEVLYHAALEESCLLAKEEGKYETFTESPASEGELQFDLWSVENTAFDKVKEDIKRYGLRNSLLVAPMPTASTSQIMGNNECFEPYTTNIYLRRTLAGEFVVVNKHLVKDLEALGLWSPAMKTEIIRHGGSIQNIPSIPDKLKTVYRTVWEIQQKSLIDMAADRGPYIDQSQSLNIFMEDPTIAKLSSMHLYGWRRGLKTGMYYLRTRPKAKPIQVTVPVEKQVSLPPTEEQKLACSRDNPEGCLMCSG